tara:strand:+ start:478 stop:840 length:363 start_codon:yes stop_codon:yes gene_type:complete
VGYKKQYKIKNAKYRLSEGIGVYQVMLGNICLYVGEGVINERRLRHMKSRFGNEGGKIESAFKLSRVYEYCLKQNINRELLSFNVLELQDDTVRRKELEDWYITFLTPVINSNPPLGLYV